MNSNRFLNHLRTRLLGPPATRLGSRLNTVVKLLVVEGQHDVTFLRVISRILHADDHTLPDMGKLERAGALVMLPIGGGDLLAWATRMAALGLPEFHLLFGSQEDVACYKLSPAIQVHWLADGNHDFKPRRASGRTEQGNWTEAIDAIEQFVFGLKPC